MEQESTAEFFSLEIDNLIKSHLYEAAKWGKFLAIMGFIICGLIILIGIFFGSIMGKFAGADEALGGGMMAGMGAMMAVVYVVIAVVYFFPCLYLFRFATKMKTALNGNDQAQLNASFENLKSMFKFVGILTVIILVLYAVLFLFAIVAGVASTSFN